MNYPKRLIEVDLPIKKISTHARRDKSVRQGHVKALHLWWARRPLSACRAVLCAALWPDPADPDCPLGFRQDAVDLITTFAANATSDKALKEHCSKQAWDKWQAISKNRAGLDPLNSAHCNILRFALLDFIADFAAWDNMRTPEYVETARALTASAHRALSGDATTRPLVVDPFAGAGSIPMESLRIGADCFASDLNPVAVILNKVVLEYMPKFGSRLTVEVQKWGDWIAREARVQLADLYRNDVDGATPIAYIWARTIRCEGPGCGAEVPMLRSKWLAKKGASKTGFNLVIDKSQKTISLAIDGKAGQDWDLGTIKNGAVSCPVCGYTTDNKRVRAQLTETSGGAKTARLLVVVVDSPSASLPCACSGDMYCQVPRIVPACVTSVTVSSSPATARSIFASPKSRTFTPDFVSMILAGFRSRCTIPLRCAASSAAANWSASGSAFSGANEPLARRASNVSPSTSSITITGWPANSSTP